MSEQQVSPIVDADGHVLEPGDMYQNYIDPQYRDRALRIEVDARGHENLIIDNKPYQSESMRGNLGAIGGIGMDRKKLLSRGMVTYAEGSPAGGYDPKARLIADCKCLRPSLSQSYGTLSERITCPGSSSRRRGPFFHSRNCPPL